VFCALAFDHSCLRRHPPLAPFQKKMNESVGPSANIKSDVVDALVELLDGREACHTRYSIESFIHITLNQAGRSRDSNIEWCHQILDLCKTPHFLGLLRNCEFDQCAGNALAGAFSSFLAYRPAGDFGIFTRVTHKNAVFLYFKEHWQVCDREIVANKLVPIARGDSILYQKAARTRATAGIECFLLCAKRLSVVRDVRVLIARLLWSARGTWIK
jgi:hypothetical protein